VLGLGLGLLVLVLLGLGLGLEVEVVLLGLGLGLGDAVLLAAKISEADTASAVPALGLGRAPVAGITAAVDAGRVAHGFFAA